MPRTTREWLDKNLSKFISRKLFVFFISSAFLLVDKVTADHWVSIAVAYVGMEGFADIFIRIKQSKAKNETDIP